MGCGRFEQDVLDFPWFYIFDGGAAADNPVKGDLNYE